MKEAGIAKPRTSHEDAALEAIKDYAAATHAGDTAQAQDALNRILRLYPASAFRPKTTAPTSGCAVLLADGTQLGHLFNERGFVIDLGEIFGHSALRYLGDDRFDQVYMRSSSGNIYRIAQEGSTLEYTLTNANSGKVYGFPSHFPIDYKITIGSPFAGEIVKDGSPAIRLSSPITEVVLVRSRRKYSPASIRGLAGMGSAILEEFEQLFRPGGKIAVAPRGAVALSHNTQLGHSVQKASLFELFKDGNGHEAVGPVTHLYIRTSSKNIYRFEKDLPERGYVRIIDMRASLKAGRISERVMLLEDLVNTRFEEGKSCSFGPVATSALQEIIVVNVHNQFSPRQIEEFTDGAQSSIVDEFNNEVRGALSK